MTAPKKPQDHKSKDEGKNAPPYVFHVGDDTYSLDLKHPDLTAGFFRRNRKLSEDDQLFTILETIADEDTLAAIDTMNTDEFGHFVEGFYEQLGAEPGE